MKKLMLLSILGLYSFASSFESFVGDHNSKNCSVRILDLKKTAPLNYGISFPEWKYQVALFKKAELVNEFIISEDSRVYDSGERLTFEETMYGDFTSTDYKLVLHKSAQSIKSVILYKENFLGFKSKKFACSF